MKTDLKEKLKKEEVKSSVPAPFVSRPDVVVEGDLNKEEIIHNQYLSKEKEIPNVVDFPKEESNDQWKEWDG